MNTDIKNLFERREEAYKQQTNEIIAALTPNVISAVIEALGLPADQLGRLEWHKVDIAKDYIQLLGVIGYKEGEVIEEEGQKFTLTAQTAALLTKFVRVALPIEVASATRDEIVAHLREVEEQLKRDYEAVYGQNEIQQAEHIDLNDIEGDTIEEKLANVAASLEESDILAESDLAGFDYTALTDEQRRSLQITRLAADAPKPGSKKN